MKKDIAIVGGGVIGLFSAYYLAKEGHSVVIIDKDVDKGNCSYGNAGMIVPSHVIPLAAPGMISKGIKWMFNSKSPFYVRPRLKGELMAWGLKFYRSANKEQVEFAKPHLRDISLLSKSLYQDLAKEYDAFSYDEKGLLMLFQSAHMQEEEIDAAMQAQDLGLDVDILDKAALSKLEGGIEIDAIGAVHYKSDAHLHPNKLMEFLKKKLAELGVDLRSNTTVVDVDVNARTINHLVTDKGTVIADEYIIAGGAWSAKLAKMFDQKMLLLPGKGYSFTFENAASRPSVPSILCEGKVAVTPMGKDLRFGGTMEITDVQDNNINMNRVQGIVDAINKFYPKLNISLPKESDVWKGFRPCSPDGLPYISRSASMNNVTFATGHGMMGLSLGPATGLLVSQVVQGKQSEISLDPYSLDR